MKKEKNKKTALESCEVEKDDKEEEKKKEEEEKEEKE